MANTSNSLYQKSINNDCFARQSIFEYSTTPNYELGEKRELADGRTFRYAFAGATSLVAGTLQQAPAPQANHLNMVCTVASATAGGRIGDKTITVTDGGTAFVANEYAGGFLHINVTPGLGYVYKIASHPANAGSATCVFTLYDPIQIAVTASSYATVTYPIFGPNPAAKTTGTIICPTTLTSIPIGVSPVAATSNNYYWLQTRGPASILTDGTLVIGNQVGNSATTAGAVGPMSGGDLRGCVGKCLQVNATANNSLIFLMCE